MVDNFGRDLVPYVSNRPVTKRNVPIKLEDPHPVKRLERHLDTGNASLDGYSVLARARPGSPSPPVGGTEGRAYMGPDEDFEQ